MPRLRIRTTSQDGALLEVRLRRRADGGVSVEEVWIETDYENGVPTASRERRLSEDVDLQERARLKAAFDAEERRIRRRDYS